MGLIVVSLSLREPWIAEEVGFKAIAERLIVVDDERVPERDTESENLTMTGGLNLEVLSFVHVDELERRSHKIWLA